jgi:branched-chain amino acid transport system substrate-binding protein
MQIARRSFVVAAAASALALPRQVRAASRLTVLQMVPRTGPPAPVGIGLATGAGLFFSHRNALAAGADPIDVVTLEDPRELDRSLALLREAVGRHRPALVMHTLNADLNRALIDSDLLRTQALAVLGAWTGATSVRSRADPGLFFTRASIRNECRRMVDYAQTIGFRRAAVVFQDDAFGRDALEQIRQAIAGSPVSLVAAVGHNRLDPKAPPDALPASMAAAVQAVRRTEPQAVLYFGSSAQCAELAARTAGLAGPRVPLISASTVDAAELIRIAGGDIVRGVVIVQPMPNAAVPSTPLVREFHAAGLARGGEGWKPSQFLLEGFFNAKIALEAFRRARGREPAAVSAALASMARWDAGGLQIDFSNGRREGSSFTALAVLDQRGQLRY